MIEIRLVVFVTVLAIMMAAEAIWSKRERENDLLVRWPGNFGVAMLGTVVVRLLLPLTATGVALSGTENGTGLFNVVAIPSMIVLLASLLLMDMLIYLQHRVFHAIPLLWRVHRMHHTDLELDASTGLRFHPIELLLSMLIKLSAIAILGIPAVAVLIFEMLLNGCSIFNHANVSLPAGVDALLRKFVVTPDMHRVHHSVVPAETDSNFGFCLPWWDRLFGTYTAQPQQGHKDMQIGLASHREQARALRLDHMLIEPFMQPAVEQRGDKT